MPSGGMTVLAYPTTPASPSPTALNLTVPPVMKALLKRAGYGPDQLYMLGTIRCRTSRR
jgi:hypothetical protein